MTCRIVIPIKAPALCKTRLAPILGEAERQAIVAEMLRRTVSAASDATGADEFFLLGPSRHGLPDHIPLLADEGQGLNASLAAARDEALGEGITRLLLLSADLPLLTADDVAFLLRSPADAVAAAPDRSGYGTNALLLPLPAAAHFLFRYGEDSLTAHRAEAARLGLPFVTVKRLGLALDIDTPADLSLWHLSGSPA